MPGEVNCVFTKGLIPFVEKEVGPEAVATICRIAGRSRDYLMADHNWIPLAVAGEMVKACQALMHEPDEERWARRYGESFMDWKPREERSYLGTYSMGIGSPARRVRAGGHHLRSAEPRVLPARSPRGRPPPRALPLDAAARAGHPGLDLLVAQGAVRALPDQLGPAARRGPREHVRGPRRRCLPLGRSLEESVAGAPFWAPSLIGGTVAVLLGLASAAPGGSWPLLAAAPLPLLAGVALGYALREGHQRRHTQSLLDLQSEEIIYSNRELEKKFVELETRIQQLSLLTDLSAAVSGTLDPEKIYDQALTWLVHRMAYQKAYLSLVDRERRVLRGHRAAGAESEAVPFEGVEIPSRRKRARALGPPSPDRPCSSTTWSRQPSPCTAPSSAPIRCEASWWCRSACASRCSACSR